MSIMKCHDFCWLAFFHSFFRPVMEYPQPAEGGEQEGENKKKN
jgi:hypothetical protein